MPQPPEEGSPAWPQADADWPTAEPDPPQPSERAEERTRYLPPITPQGQPEAAQQHGTDAPTVSNALPVEPPTVTNLTPVAAQQQPIPPTARAMPVRIDPVGGEPPQAAPEPAPEPERKRRKHPVLWSLLVLLLVIGVAAGVFFAVPGVASKVGLPQFDPAQTAQDPPEPITVRPKLRAATGKPASASGVSSALQQVSADPALARLTGVVLDAATGKPLWNSDPGTPLAPGSTNKLLTAAASLLTLDPQQTLTTKVVAGKEPGSVVIVGGGDPTLTALPAGEQSIYGQTPRLDDLVAQVKKKTGGQVTSVGVDQRAFRGDSMAKGWVQPDIAAGNFTPIVPGMLDGGRQDPQELNSPRSANPAGDLVDEFASRIGASPAGEQEAPRGARVLGVVHSAPVEDLIATMLDTSDNVLAEMMARQVAKATGNEPSFTGGAKAVLQTLRKNGFDTSGATLSDASGLSTENRLPARLLGSILGAAARTGLDDPRTVRLRPLLAGLPVAGGTGTLAEDRFTDPETSEGKGYVRAKTGTLSDVSSLAGVVLDKDNRLLVFALMSNGSSPADARPALDAIATKLRECGC